MAEELTLLAVTRMQSGFCIAGIDQKGQWQRPVKRFDTLLLGDISYRDRTIMRPFDRVRFNVERSAPDPPHVEDCVCDFVRARPERLGHMDALELSKFLENNAEPGPGPVLDGQRSLVLFGVDSLGTSFSLDGYSGRYETRVRVPGVGDEHGLACTDLRWRAFGRSLLPSSGGRVVLGTQQIRDRLGARQLYIALGLARERDGKFSPLVVGVHVVPEYEVIVDPKHP